MWFMKKHLQNILLIFGSLMFVLLALEVSLRLVLSPNADGNLVVRGKLLRPYQFPQNNLAKIHNIKSYFCITAV